MDLETQGVSPGSCSVTLSNGVSTQTAKAGAGLVGVTVNAGPCSTLPDGSIYVPVGSTCPSGSYTLTQPNVCVEQGESQLNGTAVVFGAFPNAPTDGPTDKPIVDGPGSSPYGTLTEPTSGNATIGFTRTAPGTVTVTIYETLLDYRAVPGENGNPEQCEGYITQLVLGTITYE